MRSLKSACDDVEGRISGSIIQTSTERVGRRSRRPLHRPLIDATCTRPFVTPEEETYCVKKVYDNLLRHLAIIALILRRYHCHSVRAVLGHELLVVQML